MLYASSGLNVAEIGRIMWMIRYKVVELGAGNCS